VINLTIPKDPNIWKNLIDNLPPSENLPENGISAPAIETIEPKIKKINDGNAKVFVQRIKTIVYLYTDRQGKHYGEQSYQNLTTMGEIPLSEALNAFKNDPDTKEK